MTVHGYSNVPAVAFLALSLGAGGYGMTRTGQKGLLKFQPTRPGVVAKTLVFPSDRHRPGSRCSRQHRRLFTPLNGNICSRSRILVCIGDIDIERLQPSAR